MATADLEREILALSTLLGEARMRYHLRKTPQASFEKLSELDFEIREALVKPHSPELQVDVRRLTARLRALAPG